MKPRGRSPYRLRADGEQKGTTLARICGPYFGNRGPQWASAERTRSLRWLAGTRRTKRLMRRARPWWLR